MRNYHVHSCIVFISLTFIVESSSAKADEEFCFGWIQHTKMNTVVGESRCLKRNGWRLKQYLIERVAESNSMQLLLDPAKSDNQSIVFKDYEDTKIRLHFSHFKILDSERETCFKDKPHQCPEEDLLVPLW